MGDHLDAEGSVRGGKADVAIGYNVDTKTNYGTVDRGYDRKGTSFWCTDGTLKPCQHFSDTESCSGRLRISIIPPCVRNLSESEQ
jgi:hypothetical protein